MRVTLDVVFFVRNIGLRKNRNWSEYKKIKKNYLSNILKSDDL
jgi:hypothetical protein